LLREDLRLCGTKEGCSEGDCGACTVALGLIENGRLKYQAVNSCILPAARLHSRHLVTIEGLAEGEELNAIQKAILDHHATQCGFCTPGVIMSLFCLFSNVRNPDQVDISAALEGNLCRCTGYLSIRRAALQVSQDLAGKLIDLRKDILPRYASRVEKELKAFRGTIGSSPATVEVLDVCLGYHLPKALPELFKLLPKLGGYRIISGGTDVMVDRNIKGAIPMNLVDISGIKGLDQFKAKKSYLYIGANATLSQVMADKLVAKKLPVLCATIGQMASAQVRNAATLAGNAANASPIADAAVALLALNARLVLGSARGTRRVAMEDFYLGYKKTCLARHEIITGIEIPLDGASTSFLKSAKRAAVDIASVNTAVSYKTGDGLPTSVRIALGGVAPVPVMARRAAGHLIGKKLTGELIAEAAGIAAQDCVPIDDVRGSARYRRLLVKNHLVRHLNSITL